MTNPKQRPDQRPGSVRHDDANLGQKEAEREKSERPEDENEEDELQPMTDKSERQRG